MWRRLLLVAPALGSLLGLGLVVVPTVRVPSSAPPPVRISRAAVTATGQAVDPGWSKVVSGGTDMVGVQWQGDRSATFAIERQDAAGRWTSAGEIGVPDGGPDRGSREARLAPSDHVSEPIWVGDARAIRIRVHHASVRAVNLQKLTVPRSRPAANVASAAAPQPAVISRAQWGADENLRLANCPEGPTYDANVDLAIIHHTAGDNNYGPGDSARIVRALYAYATQTLKYCDTHYNFLVDKYGQVFEGRYGGIASAVHGAHAVGFNTNTTGIAAIGDFQSAGAPSAMVDAISRLVAWKFEVHGVDPTRPVTYVTFGNDRFPAGTALSLPRVIGHGDTWFTSCPGQYLAAQKPRIQLVATSLMLSHRGWGSWTPFPGAVASAPATASWAPNRLDLFAIAGGDLIHKWGDGLRWYPTATTWENLGAPAEGLQGAPTAVSWGHDRVDVFATAKDDSLVHRAWDTTHWTDWENLGGQLSSAPAAASWGPNRLDVFATGPDGDLVHKWSQGTWSGWESLGGAVIGDPAASSWGQTRVDVWVRGTDDAVWHRWWIPGGWSRWESLGGALTEAPSAASWQPGRVDVFGRGTDDALWHRWYDGGWHDWEPLGGILTSKPSAVAKSWIRIDVFARGTDDRIWTRTYG